MHEDNLRIQEEMMNPISFVARNNTKNIYYHQAMKATDAREFTKSIIKELNTHTERNH